VYEWDREIISRLLDGLKEAAATIVKPGKPVAVLPLVPEFIRNKDGDGKQDCDGMRRNGG
jgi:hypothetical protein